MINGKVMVSVWENNRDDSKDSATQNILRKLQQGDQVYVELQSGRKLCNFGDSEIVNVFSGHMLYPSIEP